MNGHSRTFWFTVGAIAAVFYLVGAVTIMSPVVEPTWLKNITPLEHLLLHTGFVILGGLLGGMLGVIATLSYKERQP